MRLKLLFIVLGTFFTGSLFSQNKEKVTASVPLEQQAIHPTRSEIAEFAKKYLGTPYRYASSNPVVGFDCSGFVNYVFKKFNILVPRSSSAFAAIGRALTPEEFKVGDILVFYGFKDITHVGHVGIICVADGMKSKFIHASSGNAYGVTISELNSAMYTRRFYKCVDVID